MSLNIIDNSLDKKIIEDLKNILEIYKKIILILEF
jgi:hypothetical protein